MERLSEAPAIPSRAIRRRKSLTDGIPSFDGSSAEQLTWRSVFQRKVEFERLLQHRMNHSSVGLLPALSRSNSAVRKDQAKRRQLSGSRTLGTPRSANTSVLSHLQTTATAMPSRVNAIDLTCLEITTAVMTSPTLSPSNRFAYERLDYIKRNHPDAFMADRSRDLRHEHSSGRTLSFIPTLQNKPEGKVPANGLVKEVYEDALELKSMINETKALKPNSAVSRIEATPKPLCTRKPNSATPKKSGGRSILKRIKAKFEKDVPPALATEVVEKRSVRNTKKDIWFDGISNLKTGKPALKEQSLPAEVKRRKNYRLFGSASTQSSRRSVRFSVSDTIYEYDSET